MKKIELKGKKEQKKIKKQNRGITLVVLVITIIILLILAGITIATLMGQNGLITKAEQAKSVQIKAEMEEKLILIMSDLQIENEGSATLEDLTQDYFNENVKDYKCVVEDDDTIDGKKIIMEKDGVKEIFIIGQDMSIKERNTEIKFVYEIKETRGEIAFLLISVEDSEYGIEKVELQNKDEIIANGEKEIGIDYEVEMGKEYQIKITSTRGDVKTGKILVNVEKTFLYNEGEDNTELTGGFDIAGNLKYNGTFTIFDNYMRLSVPGSGAASYIREINLLNLKDYDKICVNLTENMQYGSASAEVFLSTQLNYYGVDVYGGNLGIFEAYIRQGDHLVELDIRNLEEQAYLYMRQTHTGFVDIKQIWLEKYML